MESEYVSLLCQFHAASVEYVVVGGYAVVAQGYPRATGDIDLLVNPTPANARRVVAALAAYDFTMVPNFLSFSRADVWIDVLTEVRGVSFAEATAQALVVAWDGLPVHYTGLVALRRAEAASARP